MRHPGKRERVFLLLGKRVPDDCIVQICGAVESRCAFGAAHGDVVGVLRLRDAVVTQYGLDNFAFGGGHGSNAALISRLKTVAFRGER